MLTGYVFETAEPILAAMESAMPSQKDAHARVYRAIIRAYGSVAGWYRAKAERAAAEARLVELAKTDAGTAAFLERIEKSHAAWRNR